MVEFFYWGVGGVTDDHPDGDMAYMTRADFDAREAEYRDAEVLMARMREVVAAATARADAASARADKAEALLREARVGLDQCACCGWSELVARIDAALEEKK